MTFILQTTKRTNEDVTDMRAEGKLPAVVYGPEMEAVSLSVNTIPFEKLYSEAGESSLVDLVVDGGEPVKVLIQEVQYDPVKRNSIHVDFRQIRMGVEMTATVELKFVGESAAVKALGGTLNTSTHSVTVRCLPKDLVGSIIVDLSVLKTFDDAIAISDLKLPEGVTVDDNETNLVVKVTAPLTEDQLKAMDEAEAPSIEDVVVEGEKKEGDEGEKKEGDEGDEGEKKEGIK
ncbi:MAG: 50S ribosomal protein L25 [Candidatus Magasanikbacteria bacterium]